MPRGIFARPSAEERFWAKVDREGPGGCWVWTGSLTRGYGALRVGERNVRVHRFAYELLVGPIPDGLQVDHLCHDPAQCQGGPGCEHRRCVNPEHLGLATSRENTLRGWSAAAVHAAKTHCPQGHAYDEANTCHRGGRRYCRVCDRDRTRSRRAARAVTL